jgi:hypothetical protein
MAEEKMNNKIYQLLKDCYSFTSGCANESVLEKRRKTASFGGVKSIKKYS